MSEWTPTESHRLTVNGFELVGKITATRFNAYHEVVLLNLEDHFSVSVKIVPTEYGAILAVPRTAEGLEWLLAILDQLLWAYLVRAPVEGLV